MSESQKGYKEYTEVKPSLEVEFFGQPILIPKKLFLNDILLFVLVALLIIRNISYSPAAKAVVAYLDLQDIKLRDDLDDLCGEIRLLLGCQRVMICQFHNGQYDSQTYAWKRLSCVAESCAQGIESKINDLQKLNVAHVFSVQDISRMRETPRTEVFDRFSVDSIAVSDRCKHHLLEQGIETAYYHLLRDPIKKDVYGYVCAQFVSVESSIKDLDVRILRDVARRCDRINACILRLEKTMQYRFTQLFRKLLKGDS